MYVIIIGEGRRVYFLAQEFTRKGYQMAIVTPDEAEARLLSQQVHATVMVGDGTELAVQEEAGARKADAFVALLDRDEDNLIACQLAQRAFGVAHTLALIHDPENETIFQQLGVSSTVSVNRIIALMLEEQIGFGEVTSLISLARGRVTITEIVLPAGAPALEKTLSELNLPENSLVAAVVRDEDVTIPHGASRFLPADRLILITQPDTYDETVEALVGKHL